jgi:endonuclease/exonuclease/phosphatase family metal-dependent hydrolase
MLVAEDTPILHASRLPSLQGSHSLARTSNSARGLVIFASCLTLTIRILLSVQVDNLHTFWPSSQWHSTLPKGWKPLAPGEPLQLLSLNVFLRPFPVGEMTDFKNERLPLLVDAASNYDFACNQEVFIKGSFLAGLRDRGLQYAVFTHLPGLRGLLRFPPKFVDGGLTIASRYPILAEDSIVYDDCVVSSVDAIVAKGVLYAFIKLAPGVRVHVFTTHLQAANGRDDLKYRIVRQAQLAQLARFVHSKITSPSNALFPTILAGDFNVDGLVGTEYARMMRTLSVDISGNVRDLLLEANNNTHIVTSAGGLDGLSQKGGVGERLDYVFYVAPIADTKAFVADAVQLMPSWTAPVAAVNPLAVKVAKASALQFRTLSDHYGVEVNFDLRFRNSSFS